MRTTEPTTDLTLPTPAGRRPRGRRILGGAAAAVLALGALGACADDDTTGDDPGVITDGDDFGDDGLDDGDDGFDDGDDDLDDGFDDDLGDG